MISRVTQPLIARAIIPHIEKALNLSGFEGNASIAAHYLAAQCTVSQLGMWITTGKTGVEGLIACVLPTNPMVQYPEIAVNANWGPRAAGRQMVNEAIAFVKENGYSTLIVCNRTGRSDAVFERLYGIAGRKMVPIGTTYEFVEVQPDEPPQPDPLW